MQGNERWPPSNPSQRLRAARVMPQWITARGTALPPPPPPPDDPLPPEPEYEVIEFPGQQTYSNQPVIRNKEKDRKRCDLCGSSAPAVRCMQCVQQNFCYSCDDMYHRHPKRQAHVRRALNAEGGRPPLPPKGEPPPPPVPPPRRNKRATPRPSPQPPNIPPPSPHLFQRESASPKPGIMGNLKKMIGPRLVPGASQTLDRQHSLPPHASLMNFHEQQMMHQNGFSEWQEMQRGHRSGSFSTLNQPTFGHMMQAQSMAHLNCPSCHGHGMWTPWAGMPPGGTWQSSNFLNRGPPKEDFSDSDSDAAWQRERLRRFSTMSARAPKTYMCDDTQSVRGGRRTDVETSSHRGGRRRDLDTLSNHGGRKQDFDTMSNRGGRRKDVDTISNRGGRKQDFDTMSLRGGRKSDIDSSTLRPHRKYVEEKPHKKLIDDRFRNETDESESFEERESDDDLRFSRRGRKVMSDLEDVQKGRRFTQPASPVNKVENPQKKKNKRNERFSDTGRRRSSPINYKYESPSEEEPEPVVDLGEEQNGNIENGVETVLDEPEEEEVELGPIPDSEWECEHCTFVNEGGTRVCAVCCKTSSKPKLTNQQQNQAKSSQGTASKNLQSTSIKSSQGPPSKPTPNPPQKLVDDLKKNLTLEDKGTKEEASSKTEKMKEKRGTQSPERTRSLTSKGTSPPPQSISTQTYEEAGQKLKRATSLADYSDWKAPQRSASRQSLFSDSQSLPVTPPRAQSPERFRQGITRRPSDLFSQRSLKRAGSQPPDYISTLVQKQVKQGLEMVKLLREAEENQFSAEDLAVALLHCGDGDPIIWLQENWRNMIDTVVTLGTNYGQERKENTVGTISASEAREALRTNDGNVWAAVTECVEQRQRKYGELLGRGNFSREDIVTALTATHGNVEEAYKELNKNQLKPFLMRIWGPPQGVDNDDGDFTKLAHGDLVGRGGKNVEEVSVDLSIDSNYERIQNWLENHVYNSNKTNLSQSMLQLTSGGISRSGSELRINTFLDSNSNSTIQKARHNSDVQRYLKTLYNANNKSLLIKNHSISTQNLNNKSYSEYKFPVSKESSPSQSNKLLNEKTKVDKNNNDGEIETITIKLNPTIVKSEESLLNVQDEDKSREAETSSEESESEDESESDTSSESSKTSSEANQYLKINEGQIQNTFSISGHSSEKSDRNQELLRSNSVTSSESFESVHSSVDDNKEIVKNSSQKNSRRNQEQNSKTEEPRNELSEPDYVNLSDLNMNDHEQKQILVTNDLTQEQTSDEIYSQQTVNAKTKMNLHEEKNTGMILENKTEKNQQPMATAENSNKSLAIKSETQDSVTGNGTNVSITAGDRNNSLDNSTSTNESDEKFMEIASEDDIPYFDEETEPNIPETMERVVTVTKSNETGNEDKTNLYSTEVPRITKFSDDLNNLRERLYSTLSVNSENTKIISNSKSSSDNNDARSNDFSEESFDFDESRQFSPINLLKRDPSLRFSDGNSEKDFSSIPTDSERDLFLDAKHENETKQRNVINSSSNSQVELLELLKKSLSKDEVVEKIVSTLFATVLQASVDVNNHNQQKKFESFKAGDNINNENINKNENFKDGNQKDSGQGKNSIERSQYQSVEKESQQVSTLIPTDILERQTDPKNETLKTIINDEDNLESTGKKSEYHVSGTEPNAESATEIERVTTHPSAEQMEVSLSQEGINGELVIHDSKNKNITISDLEMIKSIPQSTELKNLKAQGTALKDSLEGGIKIEHPTPQGLKVDSFVQESSENGHSVQIDSEKEHSLLIGTETGNDMLVTNKVEKNISGSNDLENSVLNGTEMHNSIPISGNSEHVMPESNEMEHSTPEGNTIDQSIQKDTELFQSISDCSTNINLIPSSPVLEQSTQSNNKKEIQTEIDNSITDDTNVEKLKSESTRRGDSVPIESNIAHDESNEKEVHNTGTGSTEDRKLVIESTGMQNMGMGNTEKENLIEKDTQDNLRGKDTIMEVPHNVVLAEQDLPLKEIEENITNTTQVDLFKNKNKSTNKNSKKGKAVNNTSKVKSANKARSTSPDKNVSEAQIIITDEIINKSPDTITTLYPNEKNKIITTNENSPSILSESQLATETESEEENTQIFNPEREARRLLAEGLVKTYEQAEIAIQLKDLNLNDEIILAAANECHSLEAAIAFLQQECQLCAGKYTVKEMVSLLECEHQCCLECANNYFSLQITERSINDCVCPFCKEPDILHIEEDKALTYFSHLDIFLKGIVKENIHELFQRKLRDRTLMQDPNFKWCIKCSSGFIANPRQKRFTCPDCKAITCAKCMKPWEKEHEKMSCEEYKKWLLQNDPEHQLEKHLDENGVTCPKCRTKYLLAKGGCMHLTCPQCKYEFCSGCSKPFLMGRKCTVSEYCEKLGLHSHHPRNCLFYLRDKEPEELERLLEDNKIDFKRGGDNEVKRCGVQLLKETTDGFVEAVCGQTTLKAGLCRTHYVESLVLRIRMNNVDPVKLLDFGEALQELRRNGKALPERPAGMSEFNYRQICYKVIEEEIPLE